MINGLSQFGHGFPVGLTWGHLLNQMQQPMPFGMPQRPKKKPQLGDIARPMPQPGFGMQPGFAPNALMNFGRQVQQY